MPNHGGHSWGECFQNVANTNNRHNNNGGGSGGGGDGNNNRNNNRGNGGNAHVNEDNNNNNNNDNSSRSSNSGRSSRQSNNNNNNQNQDDGHYVTMDSTDICLNNMFHVEDIISNEYYNDSLNRFSVDISDNCEHYVIADAMRCQEIIAPVRSPYKHDLSLSMNDLMFDSDSSSDDSNLGDKPPPLIERRCVASDSDSDDSESTAATADLTVCSWELLETDPDDIEVTTNNDTMIVSLPPARINNIPMGLSTSPYEALVAARTDNADLAPTTMITVTKLNDSLQGRFRFKVLFDS